MNTKFVIFVLLIILICPILALASACEKELTPPAVSQVLRVNLAGEPATIDPNRLSWSREHTPAVQVFEGLLCFDHDLSLKALVAQDIPSLENGGISTDLKTYTFKLRPDVTWSDGKKLKAQDFEYSIKRMLSPDIASAYASFYFDIVGAEAYNGAANEDDATKTRLKDAVGVKALDDVTLQITLNKPRYTFLQLMTLWPTYPVREDIISQYGNEWTEPPHYIGNGPYILTEWVHDDHMTFKPNPNYWGTKPKLTEIYMAMITDVNTELEAYESNKLEISRVPLGMEKTVMADPVLSKETLCYPQLSTCALEFNTKKPPFDNIKVRQALACAIDRVSLVDKVRGGVGKPALSWIPPGIPGHDPSLGKEYEFNITRAKELLAAAGYADLDNFPVLTFQYPDTAGNSLIAEFLQAQIKENLGIDLTLEPMEPKSFTQLVEQREHTWYLGWWFADYPDPDDWLPELFGTDAGQNNTGYSNPEFDALVKQAKSELDNTERLQLWDKAHKMVMADVPIVPMFYQEHLFLVKPTVEGLKTSAMDAEIPGEMLLFREVYISK
jgi:oligopeptide transport system substrate-binding protein